VLQLVTIHIWVVAYAPAKNVECMIRKIDMFFKKELDKKMPGG
jgi:hypothetical protein